MRFHFLKSTVSEHAESYCDYMVVLAFKITVLTAAQFSVGCRNSRLSCGLLNEISSTYRQRTHKARVFWDVTPCTLKDVIFHSNQPPRNYFAFIRRVEEKQVSLQLHVGKFVTNKLHKKFHLSLSTKVPNMFRLYLTLIFRDHSQA